MAKLKGQRYETIMQLIDHLLICNQHDRAALAEGSLNGSNRTVLQMTLTVRSEAIRRLIVLSFQKRQA